MIQEIRQKFVKNIRQNIKLLWWVFIFVFVVIVSTKTNLINNSFAAGVTCGTTDAIVRGDICVCKDSKKIYAWWACAIDPVNLCPPDSTTKWNTCICNDKTLLYINKSCRVSPSIECTNQWGVYSNNRCDFTQKIHWSAESSQIIPSISEKNAVEVLPIINVVNKPKQLDLNTNTLYDDHIILS